MCKLKLPIKCGRALAFSPLFLAWALQANNIQVTNLAITGTNTLDATTQVQFDITWENSWRTSSTPGNWDAAWVIVKYRNAATGLWEHARLGDDAQHVAPMGSTVFTGLLTPVQDYDAATNWGVGVFIHRSSVGTGTFTATGVGLRWNYGQNGLVEADISEVRVFAVEMALVAEGSFRTGDGISLGSQLPLQGQFNNGGTTDPFLISSENPIILGGTSLGNLANNDAVNMSDFYPDDFNNTVTRTLPASFPKGFSGFYQMKYELTQQQYVDFLNTLTRDQQASRVATTLEPGITSVVQRYVMSASTVPEIRNGIRCNATIPGDASITFYCDLNGNGTGGDANDGQWLACNYLCWGDVAAYLDWSGLRPMSELEFEKSCRGPVLPVTNDRAWGSEVFQGPDIIINAGAINESVVPEEANVAYGMGPLRVGVFASTNSTRPQSGASYYGVMELSGNVHEQCISVGNPPGRAFSGNLGDGVLDVSGNADVLTWPGGSGPGVGVRGGSWGGNAAAPVLSVSGRYYGGYTPVTREARVGGRGVRSIGTRITSLNCPTAGHNGTLMSGIPASGVSSSVPYTGGNGVAISTPVNSTGVTGLTATLVPGVLSSYGGSLTYTITGTPVGSGVASFALNIGGQSCTLTRTVFPVGTTGTTANSCGAPNVHNPNLPYGTMTDQNGNAYRTIVIGTQEWMAENLRAYTYRNGDAIPFVPDNSWNSLLTGASCWYFNDSAAYDCPIGKLYNWYAVSDARNVCPSGWHVPVAAEWGLLNSYLGPGSIVWGLAGKLKSSGTNYWIVNTGTNESGFSALASGIRTDYLGEWYGGGQQSYWWTADQTGGQTAVALSLFVYSSVLSGGDTPKTHGASVRCIKD
jgi:uncharacterized protein (TIGR02145 family)